MNISVSDLASLSEKKKERKKKQTLSFFFWERKRKEEANTLDRKENEYQSHNGKGAMSLVYS